MAAHIRHFLSQLVHEDHRWKLTLLKEWKLIIGDLHDKVKIEKIDQDTLVLSVLHPGWAQEIFLLSRVLCAKINKVLNEEKIKTIKFKTLSYNSNKKTQPVTISMGNFERVAIKNKSLFGTLTIEERNPLERVGCHDLRMILETFYMECKIRAGQEGGYYGTKNYSIGDDADVHLRNDD